MRVLLLTDSNVFAGTERHILELAAALREFDVDAIIGCPRPSPLATAAESRNIGVVPISKHSLIDREAIRTISRILRNDDVSIVHAHNGRMALQAAIARNFAGTGCCVATQHFLQPNRLSRRGVARWGSGLAHGWMNRQIDHFLAISQAVEKAMIERRDASPQKITVVFNGIPPPSVESFSRSEHIRHELGVAEACPLVVSVARLEREKSINTLIDAMALVAAKVPSAKCVIVGDGRLRKSLQQQIATARLEGIVHLIGYRSDALSIVSAADVFVLPSLAEPFGIAILEAMALGKPVIVTRAGGPVEIVEEERTGLMVSPGNVTEMADAIIRLLQNPDQIRDMGTAGRERFLRIFTANRMAQTVASTYRNLLSGVAIPA